MAVIQAGPEEGAQIRQDLLLGIDRSAGLGAVFPHRGDIRWRSRAGGGADRVIVVRYVAGILEGKQFDLAGRAQPIRPHLELGNRRELAETAVQEPAVRHARPIEDAGAQRPPVLRPLGCRTIGEAPGIGGIVEGAGIIDRPVQEIRPRVMSIAVGVENVGHGEFADGQDDIVGQMAAAQLIGARSSVLVSPPNPMT